MREIANYLMDTGHVLGVDVSKWQGKIDFGKLKAQGVRFIAIRCTVGDYYLDPNFEENWYEAKDSGLLATPYHVVAYARSNSRSIISAEAQLTWFYKNFGERKADLPVVADCEKGMVRGKSKSEVSAITWKFLQGLHGYKRFPKPFMYTNYDFVQSYLVGGRWNEYPLWVASYPREAYPVNNDYIPLVPVPWSGKWTVHQYSADGNLQGRAFGASGSASIDLDKMTIEDFDLYSNWSSPVVEPVPPVAPKPTADTFVVKGYDVTIERK